MSVPKHLIDDLPDPEAAVQFLGRLEETQASHYRKLIKNEALLSDVLTLVAFSPLLATTLLQNPDYIWWLNRRRKDKGVRGKEELLESLARFSLTNSTLQEQVVFARFRRRELLRIYLADIRRQLAIAETTEELSNLADAILEHALRSARQELDNRYGPPQESDDKGRQANARFCIVTLGKLGSRELNYSSDIDLLFLYSDEGSTTGSGSRGKITNREYFIKLAELIAKLIGQQTGEGATFRVDLRLRPHGRVGPLAMSVLDTVRYYRAEAADWERQVLIRSRAGAGDAELFSRFYSKVESLVYSESQSVGSALKSVRRSKQKIDLEHINSKGFDVKLGKGGIREIEFIAQALQLAYGGRDRWLRASHTLISLGRLSDRGLIEESELANLHDAYNFLRQLEHILQMENGLQTHLVPDEPIRRLLVARRMRFSSISELDAAIAAHTLNVNSVFTRVFSDQNIESSEQIEHFAIEGYWAVDDTTELSRPATGSREDEVAVLCRISPKFAQLVNRDSISPSLHSPEEFQDRLLEAIRNKSSLGERLNSLRREWRRCLIGVAALDASEAIDIRESKDRQTRLAEAAIGASLEIARIEMSQRTKVSIEQLGLAVMGLGKLGGAGIDYDSDLDLVLVFEERREDLPHDISEIEFYSRAAETFINALSNFTREGNLYRVDLRLRPHGKNGPQAISLRSFESYIREDAAIWELLAFVKLRGAGGGELASRTQQHITWLVHQRASTIPAAELAQETVRVRSLLEKQRGSLRGGEINVKHGSGGMLDIYFAIRYLQLRDNVPDTDGNRSSDSLLKTLHSRGSLSEPDFRSLYEGYKFLSALDHEMRLIIGRSHIVPLSNNPHLQTIVSRLGLTSIAEFNEELSLHRIAIREAFEAVTR
ncbi:MAG TPA: hypothetical protein VFZ49_01160 [Pyrinomonadaceae bacterium]